MPKEITPEKVKELIDNVRTACDIATEDGMYAQAPKYAYEMLKYSILVELKRFDGDYESANAFIQHIQGISAQHIQEAQSEDEC